MIRLNLPLIVTISMVCPAFAVSDEVKRPNTIDDLLKQVNQTFAEVKHPPITKEKLIALMLDGFRTIHAPHEFQNEKEVANYIRELAGSGKLTLETKTYKTWEGGEYVLDPEMDSEFRVKGPERWTIGVDIIHVYNGPKNDWIRIPLDIVPGPVSLVK